MFQEATLILSGKTMEKITHFLPCILLRECCCLWVYVCRISVQGFAKIKHVSIESRNPKKEPSSELAQCILELDDVRKNEIELLEAIQRLTKQREIWNQYLENLGKVRAT